MIGQVVYNSRSQAALTANTLPANTVAGQIARASGLKAESLGSDNRVQLLSSANLPVSAAAEAANSLILLVSGKPEKQQKAAETIRHLLDIAEARLTPKAA